MMVRAGAVLLLRSVDTGMQAPSAGMVDVLVVRQCKSARAAAAKETLG